MLASQPEVFISYDKENAADKALAEEIHKAFGERFRVRRVDLEQYRSSLGAYQKQLTNSDYVVLVVSQAYFRSIDTMFELSELGRKENFKDRIFPVVQPDTPIKDIESMLGSRLEWDEKKDKLNDLLKELDDFTGISRAIDEVDLRNRIREAIIELSIILGAMLGTEIEKHRENKFNILAEAILARQASLERKAMAHKGTPSLATHSVYLCDRSEQWQVFDYERNLRQRPSRLFMMYGLEAEMPEGFLERIKLGVQRQGAVGGNGPGAPSKGILIPKPMLPIQQTVANLIKEMLGKFGIDCNQYRDLLNQQFANILREEQAKLPAHVRQPFLIYLETYDDYFLRPQMEEVLQCFWKWVQGVGENADVEIIVLIAITAEETLSTQLEAEVKRVTQSLPEAVLLPRLASLDRSALRDWIDQNTEMDRAERKRYLDFLFGNAETLPMETVKKHLDAFVNDYPNIKIPNP
jgi:hypothetical protein